MKKILGILFVLTVMVMISPFVKASFDPLEFKVVGSDVDERDEFGAAVSIDGEYAVVGSRWDGDLGALSGSAYVFRQEGGVWEEVAKLTASDATTGNRFGTSVSIDNDYIIIGSHGNDVGDFSGAAYIFKRQLDGTWEETAKLTASDTDVEDLFGHFSSVSIEGEYAIVGAHGNDDHGERSGSAYIFKRNPDETWVEMAKITASDASEGSWFGHSVSINEEYVAVGARGIKSAYIFKRNPDETWTETTKLSLYGHLVSMDDGHLIVGDYAHGVHGEAHIFKRNPDETWVETAELTVSGDVLESKFGFSVSIDGEYAVVGTSEEDDIYFASAYIFKRNFDGSWDEVTKVVPSGVEENEFGYSVSISGENVIVGTVGEYYTSGAAYLYNFSPREIQLTTTDLVAGEYGTLTLAGALPGEEVFFKWSKDSGTTCSPIIGGHCMYLDNAKNIGVVIADADGIAEVTKTVPVEASGRPVFMQAAISRGIGGVDSVLSNVVVKDIE